MTNTTAIHTAILMPSPSVDYGAYNAPPERGSLDQSHRWVRWTGKESGSARYYVIESMAGWMIDTETTTSDVFLAGVVFNELIERSKR